MKKNSITRSLLIVEGIQVQKIDKPSLKNPNHGKTPSNIQDYLEEANEKNLDKKK
jgi:hypothetical protein